MSDARAKRRTATGCALLALSSWLADAARADHPVVRERGSRKAGRGDVETGGYRLHKAGDGEYVYEDERFTAHVASDGAVSFKDKHVSFSGGVFLGGLGKTPLSGPAWQEMFTRPAREAKQGREPGAAARISSYRPDPARDEPSRQRPDSPLYTQPVAMVGVSGTMDITDELMRLVGQDPYRYEKAKFLAATSDFRLRLAVARRRQWLREALAELPAKLEQIWRDERFSPTERRRILGMLRAELGSGDDAARPRVLIDRFLEDHREPDGGAPDGPSPGQAPDGPSGR